jgi:hypothetical protein
MPSPIARPLGAFGAALLVAVAGLPACGSSSSETSGGGGGATTTTYAAALCRYYERCAFDCAFHSS